MSEYSVHAPLPEKIGNLRVLGEVRFSGGDPIVDLRCEKEGSNGPCNREFVRRLYRLDKLPKMCARCAKRQTAEQNAARKAEPRKRTKPPPCQVCFGLPHQVPGENGDKCPNPKCMVVRDDSDQEFSVRTPVKPRPVIVPPPPVGTVLLSKVRIDGGTQARVELDELVVEEYTAVITEGGKLPPPEVYYDGGCYWIGDGFHRVHAHLRAGRTHIECIVRAGDRRAAILHAAGANADHGLRRTNADKRRAVIMLFTDLEWGKNSDRWIAEKARVSQATVTRMRREQRAERQSRISRGETPTPEPTVRRGRDGKVRRLPLRSPPVWSNEKALARLDAIVDELVAGWPEGESREPLVARLRDRATAIEEVRRAG